MAYTYDPAKGMQYGNGGRGPSTKDGNGFITQVGNLTGDDIKGSMKPQAINDYFKRQALIDVVKEQYFQPLATVTNLAENNGKYIKQYVFFPLLDDRNKNDQGIDANGLVYEDGNLYGSSKDISTITGKLPTLTETGGRYNRVGFTRAMIEGTITKLGFFYEFTDEELAFDTMADLKAHFNREAVRGANEITEDCLQIDLINGAGVNMWCGGATSNATMTATSELTYKDLIKLSKELDDNHVSQTYKMFTGSTNTDTRTVAGGWTIYCGSEMRETFMSMLDLHGRPAFVPVEQYAAGTEPVRGEVGRVYKFRIVEVPEMMKWAGAGATAGADDAVSTTDGKIDVFPLLIIGNESFTSIGFRTNGKTFNFKTIEKMPGEATADRNDPYGETGFWSIKWWYGTMILRPERLFCIHSVARV